MPVLDSLSLFKTEDPDSYFLGFKPKKIEHYEKAFTHRSLNLKDKHGNALNYERLEFLGDAMLSSIIAAHLFKEVPEGNETFRNLHSRSVSSHLFEIWPQ